MGFFSPVKVQRSADACIDCTKCSDVCPAGILVHRARTVASDECILCADCVQVCPESEALFLSASVKHRRKIPVFAVGLCIVLIFGAFIGSAKLTGRWDNAISNAEYQKRILEIDKPVYRHHRGTVPAYTNAD